MSFADLNHRLSEAVMTHLHDGDCQYQGSGVTHTDVRYALDVDFEVYDQDQVAMRVTTISVQISQVPSSKQGDQIITPSRTWTVQQTLEDDGYLRRLWVS